MHASRGPDEVHQVMKVKVLVTQSCLTLFDSMDCSLPGSSVHGILQARILEWVAISFPRGSSQPRMKPRSLALWADSLPWEPPGKPHQLVVMQSATKLLVAMRSAQRHCKSAYKCRRLLFRICAKSCLFAIQKAPKLKKTHLSHGSLQHYLQ